MKCLNSCELYNTYAITIVTKLIFHWQVELWFSQVYADIHAPAYLKSKRT